MYKKIDKLSKNNNYIYMFFAYGLENYSNRSLLTNDRFFLVNEDGIITLIRNINIIKDLLLNCCKNIDDRFLLQKLKTKYKVWYFLECILYALYKDIYILNLLQKVKRWKK